MSNFASTTEGLAIGRRLQAVRKRLHLSQREFASKLGVSLRAYQNYERGEREVSATLIRALYQTARIGPVWLLLGDWERDGRSVEEANGADGAGSSRAIDRELFLAALTEVEDQARAHARKAQPGGLSAAELARLAIVVYNRVINLHAGGEQSAELTREARQIFEILGARDQSKPRAVSQGRKLQRLLKEWVRLEVTSMRAFIERTSIEMPAFAKYVAQDLDDDESTGERARWKLREQLLVEGLIGYDPGSVERFTPVDEAECVAWLESQCKKLKAHLEHLTRDISNARAHPGKRAV